MSLLRRKKAAAKKQQAHDIDPESDEGIVGIFFGVLGEIEDDFKQAVVTHLERLHAPGGFELEKSEHDFMDFGMPRSYLKSLDDIEFTVEDAVVAPNLGIRRRGMAHVVTRWTVRGVQNRPLLGIAATGQPVTIQGMTFTTFRNYNIRVDYSYWDMPELTRRMVER